MNQSESSSTVAFDVSSYAEPPFRYLSPLTYAPDISLPVPGMDGVVAQSVESVWQGLKVIDGKIDKKLFTRRPKKREGIVEGHYYGAKMLAIEEARELIYIPTYNLYLNHYASEATDAILEEQRAGKTVYVYDVSDNGDIRIPEPLAHSSVLATYLNLIIFNQTPEPRNEAETKLYDLLDTNADLKNKIQSLYPLLDEPSIRRAFRYRCIEHPRNRDDYLIAKHFSVNLLSSWGERK